ncbi:hypothetical protein GPUN_2093 [Glaciecola punicea ACAM 611]|uniref:Uncharacterized protein n=1 Tax=Glaciecola punicea ACAM 611 TaxID=1121923 RepID=H5TD31_9ALTE|nr:hypothetical protein [Glaciecola punicea]GAB56208.1 hypothetical protein GPUN_2093 [Glaciecola punicea ACAM 611]
MEIILWIFGILAVIATLRIFARSSAIKKIFKETDAEILSGARDDKIIEFAKTGNTAIGGFVIYFSHEAARKAKESLLAQNVGEEDIKSSMRDQFKDLEKNIEVCIRKRLKSLNIKMDSNGICSLR